MNEQIINLLNKLLAKELLVSHIYMLFGLTLENQGIAKMSDFFFQESSEEMMHVKKLGQRINFLNGQISMKFKDSNAIDAAEKCDDIKKIIDFSLDFEEKAVESYCNAIQICENDDHKDFGTADLLHSILTEEEQHVNYFNKELNLMKKIGIQLYIKNKI